MNDAHPPLLRVVVVDDDPDDRALVSRVLMREHPGVRIEEVIDQRGLDRALERGEYDLIVTDFQLEWSDGLAVLRAAKARHPDRPVVMFTGTGSEEIVVAAMKSGLDDYVLKSPQHLARLLASVRSVLQQAHERRAVREAQEMLASLKKAVDTLPIGVTIANTQGRIVYSNPAEALLHGYSVGELIGKQARILVPKEFWRPSTPRQIAEMKPWKRERINLRKDGTTFPAHLISEVVRTAAGDPFAIVTTCEDISERRAIEALREDVVRMMVHDLRNPLTAIKGFLDLLERSPAPLRFVERELRAVARRNAARLMDLIDAILDVSRLEKGALPLERGRVDVASLANDVFGIEEVLAREKDLRLLDDVPAGLPAAWADPDLLARVLQNLLGNAIKFTPKGGVIRLGACVELGERAIRVTVSDTGPKIPNEVLGRLFEKFASGGGAGRGSGLGLAFCRLAVEAHGGKIWVESPPGSGTTILFTIPVAD